MTDQDYLNQAIRFCDILPSLYPSDIAITVTDLEKHIFMRQAKTFHMNLSVNDPIRKGGGLEKAIQTHQSVVTRLPLELYGFQVISHTTLIVNPETGSTVGAISVGISQETESTVMTMASELLNSSKSMENFAHNLSKSSNSISQKSDLMNSDIIAVTDEINKMDNIVGYIKSVSETSNLLGLNASIEAARAGDAGRGFAVVAEEMRKLATNSKESSVEILKSLQDLKNNINGLISVIQSFSDISKEQSDQTEHIASESKTLSELSEKLAAFSRQLL